MISESLILFNKSNEYIYIHKKMDFNVTCVCPPYTYLGFFMQNRGVLCLPGHGEAVQRVLHGVRLEADRAHGQTLRDVLHLLLDLQ